ncbi:TetR/AcrR family transcriptional regulator C-terminal domain-containing protein [Streptomyces sp. NBC_00237]|uniref:TetR/AcrR family transcriptional regulator n=1 Tax=Streptomyces sp. NBC_00237 TaxID=2975687 RepID=UPI002254E10F|nr:TetR/AcrR family transcriptional regulator C-terminal domain-containing protein [Streptomyces sp. NBC_00237]MCX5199951.1 TetR/AcrR family transcriptional regulator C-terminal domain-containing protein [Streptomyces sp. NBC_00237]
MVPAADPVKKPGLRSVWLDAKTPRGSGSGSKSGSKSETKGTGGGGGRKGDPAAALDLEKITAATVALLDAEGLAKFSMRRLAAELGVTAMSVYWYVANKDDLLELALDRVAGELSPPDPDPEDDADWRVQLRQLAQSYREMLVGHPWTTGLMSRFLNIGPHMMAFSGASIAVMRKGGVPVERQGGAIAAVFQFVYGFANSEAQFYQRAAEAGITGDELYRQSMGRVTEEAVDAELFRASTEIMAARGGDTVVEMFGRDFTYALDLLIAGIEASGPSGPSGPSGSSGSSGVSGSSGSLGS